MRARPSLRVESCKCMDKRLVNQLRVSRKGQVIGDCSFWNQESRIDGDDDDDDNNDEEEGIKRWTRSACTGCREEAEVKLPQSRHCQIPVFSFTTAAN